MNRGIYVDSLAERFKEDAGKPYRPSNGEEGDRFMSAYCTDCVLCGEEGCEKGLDSASFWCDIGEEGYPAEWQYGPDGQPTCTAFEDKASKGGSSEAVAGAGRK